MYTTIFFCFASSIVRFPIKHHLHANGQLIACNLFESIGTRRNEKQMLVCPALRLCPLPMYNWEFENRSESLTRWSNASTHPVIICELRATRDLQELLFIVLPYTSYSLLFQVQTCGRFGGSTTGEIACEPTKKKMYIESNGNLRRR